MSIHLVSSSCPPRLNLLRCFRRHSSITKRRLVGGGGAPCRSAILAASGRTPRPSSPPLPSVRLLVLFFCIRVGVCCKVIGMQYNSLTSHAITFRCLVGGDGAPCCPAHYDGSSASAKGYLGDFCRHPCTVCASVPSPQPFAFCFLRASKVLFLVTLP